MTLHEGPTGRVLSGGWAAEGGGTIEGSCLERSRLTEDVQGGTWLRSVWQGPSQDSVTCGVWDGGRGRNRISVGLFWVKRSSWFLAWTSG